MYTCAMIRLWCTCAPYFVCATWFVYMCAMVCTQARTHSCIYSYIYIYIYIYICAIFGMCDMAYSHMCHDLCVIHTCATFRLHDVSHRYKYHNSYAFHDYNLHVCTYISYAWLGLFTCVPWFECMAWLIHICAIFRMRAMTHSRMFHDLRMCHHSFMWNFLLKMIYLRNPPNRET